MYAAHLVNHLAFFSNSVYKSYLVISKTGPEPGQKISGQGKMECRFQWFCKTISVLFLRLTRHLILCTAGRFFLVLYTANLFQFYFTVLLWFFSSNCWCFLQKDIMYDFLNFCFHMYKWMATFCSAARAILVFDTEHSLTRSHLSRQCPSATCQRLALPQWRP